MISYNGKSFKAEKNKTPLLFLFVFSVTAQLPRVCGTYETAMIYTMGLQRGGLNCFRNVHKGLDSEHIRSYAFSSKARLREVTQKARSTWPDQNPGLLWSAVEPPFRHPHWAFYMLVHRELFLTPGP